MRTRAATLAVTMLFALALFAQDKQQWVIEGNVKDAGGPLEGAIVTATGPEPLPPQATDAAGHFALQGHIPGRYLISVSKQGSAPPKARVIGVMAGSQVGSVDFLAGKQAVIGGRVLDANGEPMQGAFVAAWIRTFHNGQLTLVAKGSATSDDLGAYRIPGLCEGRYYLAALPSILEPRLRVPAAAPRAPAERKPGAPLRLVFYPNSPSLEGSAPIILRAGDDREGADLVTAKADSFCIYATVPAPDVTPAETVLQLYARVGGAFPTVANGDVAPGKESEICGVTAGEYSLLATSWDRRTSKATGFLRENIVIARRDVALGPLRLAAGTPLRGRVSAEGGPSDSGFPRGLTVALRRQARPIIYGDALEGAVRPDGTFALANVFPDEYGLEVAGLPRQCFVRRITQEGREVTWGVVRPGQGEILVSLGCDGAAVSGRTVDEKNDPVENATVILLPKDATDRGAIFSAQSDQTGQFVFDSGIAPGDYRLAAFAGLYEGEDRDPEFVRTHFSGATDLSVPQNGSKTVTVKVQNAH